MNLFLKHLILALLILNINIFFANQTLLGQTEAINTQTPTQEAVKEPVLIKEPVVFKEKTILYIGDEDPIGAKYRAIRIVTSIKDAVESAIIDNKNQIKTNLIKKGDTFIITIEDQEIVRILPEDLKVNEDEASILAKTWESNIKNGIKEYLKEKQLTKDKHPLHKIFISITALIVLLLLIELIRLLLTKYITSFASNALKKINLMIKELAKSKKEEEKEKKDELKSSEIDVPEIKTEEKSSPEESTEIQENKYIEKINIITTEINKLINISIRTIQFIAILVFINYSLYILPETNPYVSDIVETELSIIYVIGDVLTKFFSSSQTWQSFLNIILIIIATIAITFGINILSSIIERIINAFLLDKPTREKRVQTLAKIIKTTLKLGLIGLATVLILSELGLNVTPIIAGAGVIGLAISFGAQSLVKDIITGIFILIEDQFGIGDIVSIDGTSGVVEDMTLRVTILRDLSGSMHVIPNGQISKVTVMSKHWSRANLNIGIAYKEDIDTAINIIKETADQMQKDFPEKIIAEPQVLGVNELADSAVIIKLIIDTAPGQQWSIQREYNRRIKYALDKNNIEIPFPHRTIYVPQNIGYESKHNNT